MSLSKLWPNKTLLWKDWRLMLPLFVVWASLVTFISTFMLIYHLVRYRAVGGIFFGEYWPGFNDMYYLLNSNAGLTGLVMVLFAIVLGAYSLGKERGLGTVSLLMTMPYRRDDVFLSKFLVGFCQLSLPLLANALLMTLILWANTGVNFPFGVLAIWNWAVHSVFVLNFVLCVALLASTVSGKTLGAAFLATVILLFPVGLTALVEMNAQHWELTGLVSRGLRVYQFWIDIANDTAHYLTIPFWLEGFPSVLDRNSIAFIDGEVVEHVFANRVWAFLRENVYILYLALVAASFGVYRLAQKWFSLHQLEHDDELLALPNLRPVIRIGFTVCSALLGGAVLPALLSSEGPAQLTIILFSYVGATILSGTLASHFLQPNTRDNAGLPPMLGGAGKRKKTMPAMLLILAVVVGVVLVSVLGAPQGPSGEQISELIALSGAVMERRTTALVVPITTPLTRLGNELAHESSALLNREQGLIELLNERREALRQQGEVYSHSETRLFPLRSSVDRNILSILALEASKLYYSLPQPEEPKYTAWEAKREFVFVRQGSVWELTSISLVRSMGMPPNEPGGE